MCDVITRAVQVAYRCRAIMLNRRGHKGADGRPQLTSVRWRQNAYGVEGGSLQVPLWFTMLKTRDGRLIRLKMRQGRCVIVEGRPRVMVARYPDDSPGCAHQNCVANEAPPAIEKEDHGPLGRGSVVADAPRRDCCCGYEGREALLQVIQLALEARDNLC